MGIASGIVGAERAEWYERREERRVRYSRQFEAPLHLKTLADAGFHVKRDTGPRPASEWIAGGHADLSALGPWLDGVDPDDSLATELAEDAFYAPYLTRQRAELADLRTSEAQRLPPDFPFAEVPGLSNEMIERLSVARPESLAAAGRISGVTPAALAALLVHVRKRDRAA